MREIKFRAWGWDGAMSYDDLPGDALRWKYRDGQAVDAIMQYTGLKDKNGKEIYEGDIVSAGRQGVCPVEFAYGGWCLHGSVSFVSLFSDVDIELLGNIYENPELLEKTK